MSYTVEINTNASAGRNVTITIDRGLVSSSIKTYSETVTLTPVNGIASIAHNKGVEARAAFFIGTNGNEGINWNATSGNELNSIDVYVNESVIYTVNIICF